MRRGRALAAGLAAGLVVPVGESADAATPAPLYTATREHRADARALAARKCLDRPRFLIRPARAIPASLRARTAEVARRVHVRLTFAGFHCDPLGYRAWLRSDARRLRLSAWLCIHRGEGAWSANTGNGYYGGLQMDVQFQRGYGGDALHRFGLAHRWPAHVQMLVADRAWHSRGYTPWPNTARRCGLL